MSYKKPKSGRLRYVPVFGAETAMDASRVAKEFATFHGWMRDGYDEYGISLIQQDERLTRQLESNKRYEEMQRSLLRKGK